MSKSLLFYSIWTFSQKASCAGGIMHNFVMPLNSSQIITFEFHRIWPYLNSFLFHFWTYPYQASRDFINVCTFSTIYSWPLNDKSMKFNNSFLESIYTVHTIFLNKLFKDLFFQWNIKHNYIATSYLNVFRNNEELQKAV